MAKIPSLGGIQTPELPQRQPSAVILSAQQEAILDYARDLSGGNKIVEARAGTGKTFTLVEVSKDLHGGAAFLAFNKAIASEIQQKLATAGLDEKRVKGATFHAVGFQAWRMQNKAVQVRGEKLSILCEKIGMPRGYQTFCKKLVSLAKQSCIGVDSAMDDDFAWRQIVDHFDLLDLMPDGDFAVDEEEWLDTGLAWSLRLLRQSIAESPTMVDFDDMIYMPLLTQARFWQYNWVLIDEAQDTNYARRMIAQRLLRPGGRMIAVGDRHQAIYGFTGADSDALDLIQGDFHAGILPLTITYRCASSIVSLAQTWVPDIEARPGAPDGAVRSMDLAAFQKLVPEPHDVILCRNTKPLVQLAFNYLRNKIPCHIEGREVGASLVTLIRKWRSAATINELEKFLQEYLEREREKLLLQYKEDKLQAIEDKVETILCLAETFTGAEHPQALVDLIEAMFKDSDGLARKVLTLSTVHKSKGREWDRVYLIGRRKYMPSKYARQEWQIEQEKNLMYVAVTRARNELIDVHVP